MRIRAIEQFKWGEGKAKWIYEFHNRKDYGFHSYAFPSYYLRTPEERTAVCRHLYGNHRRGDLWTAPDEEGRIPACGGYLHPLLRRQRRAGRGWLHLSGSPVISSRFCLALPAMGAGGFVLNAKRFFGTHTLQLLLLCLERVCSKCIMKSKNCILRFVHRWNKRKNFLILRLYFICLYNLI